MRHELDDWSEVWEGGRLMRYVCRRCGAQIPALVLICGPTDEQEVRELLPADRELYVFEGLRPGHRQIEDGRALTKWSGKPECSQRALEE